MPTTDAAVMAQRDVLGRRISAARALAGYTTMADLGAALRREGVKVADRTLYALERGEQPITWELVIALVVVLEPPGGERFFWPAVSEKHVRRFQDLTTESEADAIERTASKAFLEATVDLAREKAQ